MLQTSLRALDAIRRNGSRPGARASSRMRFGDARHTAQRHHATVLRAEVTRLLVDQLGRRGQRIGH